MKFALVLFLALPMVFCEIEERNVITDIGNSLKHLAQSVGNSLHTPIDFINKEYHQIQALAKQLVSHIDPTTGEAGCTSVCGPLANLAHIPSAFSSPICGEACHLAIQTITG